ITYFSDPERKTTLRPELLDKEAEKLAVAFKAVPASQIRRFYADVGLFGRRLDREKDLSDEAIQAQMALLKAKAAYAYGRVKEKEKKKFPHELLQFFVDHADSVKDKKDFSAFRQVFEAVIAYHKFHEEDENKQRD
ncbi:MAG: type III-A CRISPR-associated protein Csm2, partial [Rhodospirillaceae bacterium]|nr:type III-A CRISPR-associated protein Csm2 [Rhodospirillaceae bacterium]